MGIQNMGFQIHKNMTSYYYYLFYTLRESNINTHVLLCYIYRSRQHGQTHNVDSTLY